VTYTKVTELVGYELEECCGHARLTGGGHHPPPMEMDDLAPPEAGSPHSAWPPEGRVPTRRGRWRITVEFEPEPTP